MRQRKTVFEAALKLACGNNIREMSALVDLCRTLPIRLGCANENRARIIPSTLQGLINSCPINFSQRAKGIPTIYSLQIMAGENATFGIHTRLINIVYKAIFLVFLLSFFGQQIFSAKQHSNFLSVAFSI